MSEFVYKPHMTYTLLQYMYEHGIYTLEDLMQYVDNGNITKEQFHSITRMYYDGVKANIEKKEG